MPESCIIIAVEYIYIYLILPYFLIECLWNSTNSSRPSRSLKQPKHKVTFTPSSIPLLLLDSQGGQCVWVRWWCWGGSGFSHNRVKQVKISRRHPLPFYVDPICRWKGKWGKKNSLSSGKVLDLSSLIMMICSLLLDVCTPRQTHMII